MSRLKNICGDLCGAAKAVKNCVAKHVMSIDPDEHRNVTDDNGFLGERFAHDLIYTSAVLTLGGSAAMAAALGLGLCPVDADTASELIRNGALTTLGINLAGLGVSVKSLVANNTKLKHEDSCEK